MRKFLTLFIKSDPQIFATSGMYGFVFLYISDLFLELSGDNNRQAQNCCSHSVNFR
jgi:hypothetical protein